MIQMEGRRTESLPFFIYKPRVLVLASSNIKASKTMLLIPSPKTTSGHAVSPSSKVTAKVPITLTIRLSTQK